MLKLAAERCISHDEDVPEVKTQLSIKKESVIQQEFPDHQQNEKDRKKIFKLFTRKIIECNNLKKQQEKKEKENNDFYISKKQVLPACIPVNFVGTENKCHYQPNEINVNVKKQMCAAGAILPRIEVTKPCDKKKVKDQKIPNDG